MKLEKLLAKAIAIAAFGFQDTFDRGGKPYILHCIWVMNHVHTVRRKILAILHDCIEDGIITYEDLRKHGFPEDILDDLKLLTHKKEDDYLTVYIPKIATSEDATAVKLEDLKHNSNLTRIKGNSKKDIDRIVLYQRAFQYLSK